MLTRQQLEAAHTLPNAKAFLRVIRRTEHGAAMMDDPRAYRRHFAGKIWPAGLTEKPRDVITAGRYSSSACGAYQFINKTWDSLKRAHPWAVFGNPMHQDLMALALIDGRRALPLVLAGKIDQAFALCALEWASLPGSPYGQPTVPLETCRQIYAASVKMYSIAKEVPKMATNPDPFNLEPAPAAGGGDTIVAPQSGEASSWVDTALNVGSIAGSLVGGPWVGAAIKGVAALAPELIRLFGKNPEITERNAKTAEMVGSIMKSVTGAANEQTAAQHIAADPAMLEAFRARLREQWHDLSEVAVAADKLEADLMDRAAARTRPETPYDSLEMAMLNNLPQYATAGAQFAITAAGLYFIADIVGKAVNIAMSGQPVPEMPGWVMMLLGSVLTVLIMEWKTVMGYVFGSTQSSATKNVLLARQAAIPKE